MPQTTQQLDLDDFGYPRQPDSRRRLRNLLVHSSRRLVLLLIYALLSLLGVLLRLARAGRRYPALNPQSFHPQRILVIRVDLIGDLVLSLPVVRTLKRTYPDAEIDLLAVPSSAQVVNADPDIAEVIGYDPNLWRRPKALLQARNWRAALALRRRLHARHYALAVSVFGPWATVIALLSGAPRRLGFGREGYPGLLTDNVPGKHWDAHDHLHEVDYCLQLAKAAGATITPADRIPRLYVSPEVRQETQQLLAQAGVTNTVPLIACHVSSNNGYSKRWPTPYWATLIDRLIREDGAQVVLTGAPNDLPLIADVTRRTHEAPINLAGKTTLAQLAALLERADVLVTGDSGPMHIAAAVGTPLIAIHGPTDPALSGPVSPKATILRSDIWCSPCYNAHGPANCRFHTTQCMKNVTPAQVLETLRTTLQRYPHQPARQETGL